MQQVSANVRKRKPQRRYPPQARRTNAGGTQNQVECRGAEGRRRRRSTGGCSQHAREWRGPSIRADRERPRREDLKVKRPVEREL